MRRQIEGDELEKEEKARPRKALFPRPRSLSYIVTARGGNTKLENIDISHLSHINISSS